jgi:hypothetical protein
VLGCKVSWQITLVNGLISLVCYTQALITVVNMFIVLDCMCLKCRDVIYIILNFIYYCITISLITVNYSCKCVYNIKPIQKQFFACCQQLEEEKVEGPFL